MPIIVGGFSGTIWGTWRRKVITVAGLVTAVTSAIIGVAKAAPIIEPWWYASRGYVREDIHGPLLNRIIQVQLNQNDARKRRLLSDVKGYEIEMQSEAAKQAPQYRSLIQQQLERTKHEIDNLDEENKSLFHEKISK